MAIKCHKQ